MGEVVRFLVERLMDFLNEEDEAVVLLRIRKPVEEIKAVLRQLQVSLTNARARLSQESINIWTADVRSVVYDATYTLENFIGTSASLQRGKYRIKTFLSERLARHTIRSKMKTIKRRISELCDVFQTFGVASSSVSTQLFVPLDRTNYSFYHVVADPEVIGLEKNIKYLVGHLVNHNITDGADVLSYQFISIYGMGGLGKTTLARKIYNHPTVKEHFDCFSWTCISQQWQIKDVLQRILIDLCPKRENEILSLEVTTDELAEQIYHTLRSKRYLIVLDDIWSTDVWEYLKVAFPFENISSKILITTRNIEVAQRVGLRAENLLYEPEVLNGEQSWELLKKKTCITRYPHPDPRDSIEFEKLGRQMLRRCNGHPLAILVLGGILATKPTLTQWEMVQKEMGTGEGLGQVHQKEVDDVLMSSYNDLPDQLKLCFMYLSKFPEDTEIEAEVLYQMWMAVGLLSSKDRRDGETMMDVAESYLGDLSKRCLVQVQVEQDDLSYPKFKSCCLHDVMRDLSKKKAENSDFFRVIGDNYNQASVLVGSSDVAAYSHPKNRKYLRLLAFEKLARGDLRNLMGKGKNDYILQIRYLRLRNSFAEFYKVSNFVISEHLQTLDLREIWLYSVADLSGILRNMGRRLQHLYLPEEIGIHTYEKLRLDGVRNLELLENFDPSWCETKDLFKLINLRKLIISKGFNRYVEDLEEIINYLQSSQASSSLRYSSLQIRLDYHDSSIYGSNENVRSILRRLWAPNTNLHRLDLTDGERSSVGMPKYDVINNASSFSTNLTSLSIFHFKLLEDPMPKLERIPNLRSLRLGDVHILGKMVCSAFGFSQLRYLKLEGLVATGGWRVCDGAMPSLSTLHIGNFWELRMVPDGFRFLHGLKELRIFKYMHPEFMSRIRSGSVPGEELGQDFYKIQHIPSIIIL